MLAKAQPECPGKQWLPSAWHQGACICGTESGLGLPSVREGFMKNSKASTGKLRWFGIKGVREVEEAGFAHLGHKV